MDSGLGRAPHILSQHPTPTLTPQPWEPAGLSSSSCLVPLAPSAGNAQHCARGREKLSGYQRLVCVGGGDRVLPPRMIRPKRQLG